MRSVVRRTHGVAYLLSRFGTVATSAKWYRAAR